MADGVIAESILQKRDKILVCGSKIVVMVLFLSLNYGYFVS